MNLKPLKSWPILASLFMLFSVICPAGVSASQRDRVFNYDDEYIQIEAGISSGQGRNVFELEVGLSPKSGWKLSADSSAKIKPLKLKIQPSKCYKLKGGAQYSQPDLSGTDDSGVYSEYYTKTALVTQEFMKLACRQKKSFDGAATLTYLLCQDNRCIGPFSKVIPFRTPDPSD